jgi:hypothetical protein
MGDGRNAAVGADLEEPVGLDLVVNLANVCVADAHFDNAVRVHEACFTDECIDKLTRSLDRRKRPGEKRVEEFGGDRFRCGAQTLNSSRRIAGTQPLGVGKV